MSRVRAAGFISAFPSFLNHKCLEMKGVTMKLMYGLFLVFLISFFLLMVNISVNQGLVSKLQSCHGQNYSSLRITYDMQTILDGLNTMLIESQPHDSVTIENEDIILSPAMYLDEFEKKLQLQESSPVNDTELELSESLKNAFIRFSYSVKAEEYVSNYQVYKEKFLNLRQYVRDIMEIKFKIIEQGDEEIVSQAIKVLKIQKKAGITGIVIIGLILFILPVYLYNNIENLTDRLSNYYKSHFNKEVVFKAEKQLEKLEELVKKILMEVDKNRAMNNPGGI